MYNIFFFVVVWTIFPHVTLRSMKTGFLKWRPDFDIAADEYQKAGWYFKHFFLNIDFCAYSDQNDIILYIYYDVFFFLCLF